MGAHFKMEAKIAYLDMINWRAKAFLYGWVGWGSEESDGKCGPLRCDMVAADDL